MAAPTQRPTAAPSTALATRTMMPPWATSVLNEFIQNGSETKYNLLLPAIAVSSEIAFGHKPKVSVVQIDTDPAHQEIYKVGWANGQDRYALGKSALEKIANAAGIQLRTRRTDDRSNPDYCEMECFAHMRNESGQPVMQCRTKAFSMPDVRAESIAQRTKMNERATDKKKSPAEIESDVDREMAQFRKHIVARTETGAITRVIRGLLGIRSQWTVDELKKPFVLMRVDFQPDPSDPEVKRFLLEQGAAASGALYAQAPSAMPRAGHAQVIDDDDEDGEALELGSGGPGAASSPVASGNGVEQTEAPLEGGPDYMSMVFEGCKALGYTTQEQADLFKRHGDNYEAMYRELNAKAK